MPVPLFITPQSLSPKSAIGVQTKLMLDDFPEWKHIYWNGSEFRSLDPRSARVESALFCRIGILKRDPPSLLARMLAGLSWWEGNQPKPALTKRLRETIWHDVSAVYVAPCSTTDCVRMKALLIALDRPFVVHLWDILDEKQADSESFRWLIKRASHVFCLTQSMIDQIAPMRSDASILLFIRRPSLHKAAAPGTEPLRIAMIGYCQPYVDGISVLNEALKIVKEQGRRFTLIYIGSRKRMQSWEARLDDKIEVSGFIESDNERDRMLSQCHVGFMPGPLASPSTNPRSRFSIPSRIMDYMATGLPIAGPIHPESATATFMNTHGLSDCLGVNSPELLAGRLLEFMDPPTWCSYSDLSAKSFLAAQPKDRSLEYWLKRASVNVSHV